MVLPLAVVALTADDLADSPAALVAETWKEYAVDAVRPVTVVDVDVTEATLVPSR